MTEPKSDPTEIVSVGAVRPHDEKPFVILEWQERQGQVTPAQAVQMAVQLLTSAIEAERDASFATWAKSMEIEQEIWVQMLMGIRGHREQIQLYAMENAEAAENRRRLREQDPRGGASEEGS